MIPLSTMLRSRSTRKTPVYIRYLGPCPNKTPETSLVTLTVVS